VDGAEFVWTQAERFDEERREVRFELEEGDMDRFDGVWRVVGADGQEGNSVVTLVVVFDIGVPVLEQSMGELLTDKIRTNSRRMLEGLKARAESE
jgi:hypothetical protein